MGLTQLQLRARYSFGDTGPMKWHFTQSQKTPGSLRMAVQPVNQARNDNQPLPFEHAHPDQCGHH